MSVYTRLLMIFVAIASIGGCDSKDITSPQESDASNQQTANSTSQESSADSEDEYDPYPEPPEGQLIPYSVLGYSSGPARIGVFNPDATATFDIGIDLIDGRLPTDLELVAVAWHLRKTKPDYGHTQVTFYLPGMNHKTTGAAAKAEMHPKCKFEWYRSNMPEQYAALFPAEETLPQETGNEPGGAESESSVR